MSELTKQAVLAALDGVKDPRTGRGLASGGLVQGLVIRDSKVGFMIEVAADQASAYARIRDAAETAVKRLDGVEGVTAVLTAHGEARPGAPAHVHPQPRPQPASPPQATELPGVTHIVAVASGKGGVGKSTVAVNLAIALRRLGKRVGLMDADIYGPSIPHLLGLTDKPNSPDGKTLQPLERHGVKAMSIGLVVSKDTPAVWRGPVATGALHQLLTQVAWAPLDILLIDMPPGTGDIHLSLTQRIALAGAVIVSTPQDVALLDARKGIAMFRKVEVPILGLIENMSTYVCPNCGHEEHLFGEGGARRTASELGAEFLGEIPLHLSIRLGSDAGEPVTVAAPQSPSAEAFTTIAERIAAQLDAGNISKPAPRIVFV